MRFFAGFVVASFLWATGGYLYLEGHLDGLLGLSPDPETEPVAGAEEADDDRARRRRQRERRRRRRLGQRRGGRGPVDRSTVTTGDDLGWDEAQNVDMNAGEERLSGAQVDAGFDGVFGRIRRCLVLVPGDADVEGRLVFGMRVAGSGSVQRVSLSGPAYVIQGESGDCLRKAARSIRFPAFDGPEMVFKYPVELE